MVTTESQARWFGFKFLPDIKKYISENYAPDNIFSKEYLDRYIEKQIEKEDDKNKDRPICNLYIEGEELSLAPGTFLYTGTITSEDGATYTMGSIGSTSKREAEKELRKIARLLGWKVEKNIEYFSKTIEK